MSYAFKILLQNLFWLLPAILIHNLSFPSRKLSILRTANIAVRDDRACMFSAVSLITIIDISSCVS